VTYSFHPDAEREHLDAVAYYEERRAGLGAEYLGDFERAMVTVCASPDRFPLALLPDIRRTSLSRFPYWIFFRTTPGDVQVLAVAHHRRRPLFWGGRR
jgi:plasmid stabilization system protein ParE